MLKNQDPLVQESPIFEDLSIYKIIRTPQNKLNLLHHDGSVSVIIPFAGLNNTSKSEIDFEHMYSKIQNMIDKIQDPNLSVQFIMTRTNNMDFPSNQGLPTYLRPRADYVKKLAENYQLFKNEFYLCLFYANTTKDKQKSFMNYFQKYVLARDTFSEDSFKERTDGLSERVSNLAAYTDMYLNLLSTDPINLRMTNLTTEDQYWDVLRKFTAPKSSKTSKIKIDQDTESPRQALFSGKRADVKKNFFMLDDYYHKVFMLDKAPRQPLFGKTIDVIESVDFEMIYSVTFRVMSYKESTDTFKLRIFNEAIKEGSNKNALIVDKQKEYDLNRIDKTYGDFVEGQSRGVSVCAALVMRVDNAYVERMAASEFMTEAEYLRKLEERLIQNVFSGFGAGEWGAEDNTQWKVFNAILPGCSNLRTPILKQMMLSSINIPYFFAMYDNQRPHIPHIGTNHFIDKRGNLFKFELKDSELAAHNYLISGTTGSGKSVLINALLTMQFSEAGNPPVICILDVGGDRGSYKKLMTLSKGVEINLAGAVKPTIQMFDLIPEKSRPTPDKIEHLVNILMEKTKNEETDEDKLREMLQDSVNAYYTEFLSKGGNNLTPYLKAEMFKNIFGFDMTPEWEQVFTLKKGEVEPDEAKMNLIKSVLDIILSSNKKTVDGFQQFDEDMVTAQLYKVYREMGKLGKYPKMTDLYNGFMKHFEENAREENGKLFFNTNDQRLLTRLANWTNQGQYQMFDRETDLDITSNVILADLKGLESNVQLQQIYTLLISELFTDKMYFIKDRRKVIVRDEAWSLMRNEKARNYFVEDMRTARKNGFVTISASQSPLDYLNPDPAAGRAIISNAQVHIFCRVEGQGLADQISQEFGIPEEMQDELQNLGVKKIFMPDGTMGAAYGEFMMLATYNGKKNFYLLKNMLHPFEYNLYSSSPADNALIDFYLYHQKDHSFHDLEEVLWHITRGQHIGDMELYEYLVKIGEKEMATKVKGK